MDYGLVGISVRRRAVKRKAMVFLSPVLFLLVTMVFFFTKS
jgi:hypothetical protein